MRRIFVGSSVEGEPQARHLIGLLKTNNDIEPFLWRTVFEPGYLTFEALEEMLRNCCAALFVATPDNDANIRGRNVKTASANIMLEFGLVAGRLGRHNIALCQYGGAELPTDLKALTLIPMTPPQDAPESEAAGLQAVGEEKLRRWASGLTGTAERIARTEIVHGYTGRWRFTIQLKRWRGLSVDFPSFVEVHGYFDLFVATDGLSGKGLAHCRLTFRIFDSRRNDQNPYQGEFRVSHEITDVLCRPDGGLNFTSTVFAQQLMTAVIEAPRELSGLAEPPEPWPFCWDLRPNGQPRALEGTLKTNVGGGTTEGSVTANKDSAAQDA